RPVTDLTKDDFEITDSGKVQTIDDCKFMSVPVETRSLDVEAAASAPPDVATNTPKAPTTRRIAIVVDDMHLLESFLFPIQKMLTDLVEALSPNDEVAIVFVSQSNLSQDFTSDPGLLRAAIGHVRASLGFGQDSMALLNPLTRVENISVDTLNNARSTVETI